MTERLVVDASVIAKVYLRDEENSDVARDLVARFTRGALDLIAPQYILYELPSAILNAVRQQRLAADIAVQAVEAFLRLELPTVGGDANLPAMIQRSYELAQNLSCRLYDALYLAVALEFDCPLVTADARLHRGLSSRVSQLVWIGDYRPEAPVSS